MSGPMSVRGGRRAGAIVVMAAFHPNNHRPLSSAICRRNCRIERCADRAAGAKRTTRKLSAVDAMRRVLGNFRGLPSEWLKSERRNADTPDASILALIGRHG